MAMEGGPELVWRRIHDSGAGPAQATGPAPFPKEFSREDRGRINQLRRAGKGRHDFQPLRLSYGFPFPLRISQSLHGLQVLSVTFKNKH